MHIKLLEIYTSTKEAIISGIIRIKHKIECLIISPFIVEFLLPFIRALYSFKALTLSISTIGITIIFCKNNEARENTIPFSQSQT